MTKLTPEVESQRWNAAEAAATYAYAPYSDLHVGALYSPVNARS